MRQKRPAALRIMRASSTRFILRGRRDDRLLHLKRGRKSRHRLCPKGETMTEAGEMTIEAGEINHGATVATVARGRPRLARDDKFSSRQDQ